MNEQISSWCQPVANSPTINKTAQVNRHLTLLQTPVNCKIIIFSCMVHLKNETPKLLGFNNSINIARKKLLLLNQLALILISNKRSNFYSLKSSFPKTCFFFHTSISTVGSSALSHLPKSFATKGRFSKCRTTHKTSPPWNKQKADSTHGPKVQHMPLI